MGEMFVGFTKEELKQIRANSDNGDESSNISTKKSSVARKTNLGSAKKAAKRDVMPKKSVSPGLEQLPEDAKLSKSKTPNEVPKTKTTSSSLPSPTKTVQQEDRSTATDSSSSSQTSPTHSTVKLKVTDNTYEVVETTPEDDDDDAASALEKFEKRRKKMEEENKKRKEMLTKALKARNEQAKQENRKLKEIQEELNKLDVNLSADVCILRNQIETASLEFMEAQKRYNKAEKEFIEAKMQMFERMERKEQLTEHLCNIIEANEVRKARKLSELMSKLEMENGVSETDTEMTLCDHYSLDEVTYAACNTLKDPRNRVPSTSPVKVPEAEPEPEPPAKEVEDDTK